MVFSVCVCVIVYDPNFCCISSLHYNEQSAAIFTPDLLLIIADSWLGTMGKQAEAELLKFSYCCLPLDSLYDN